MRIITANHWYNMNTNLTLTPKIVKLINIIHSKVHAMIILTQLIIQAIILQITHDAVMLNRKPS